MLAQVVPRSFSLSESVATSFSPSPTRTPPGAEDVPTVSADDDGRRGGGTGRSLPTGRCDGIPGWSTLHVALRVGFELLGPEAGSGSPDAGTVVFLVPSDTKALFHGMMILMWLCPAANLKDF